jgi:hypothetical protein
MWFADIYCDIGWVAGQNGHLGARRMRLSEPRLGRRGSGARQHGDGHPPLPQVHPEPHSAGRVRPGHPDSADRAAVAARPRPPVHLRATTPRQTPARNDVIDAVRWATFGQQRRRGATACAVTPRQYGAGDRNRTGDVQLGNFLTAVSRNVTSHQNSSLPARRSVPASHDLSFLLTPFGQHSRQQAQGTASCHRGPAPACRTPGI